MATKSQGDLLKMLLAISESINTHLDLDEVLVSVMSTTADAIHAEAASIVLLDEQKHELLFHVTHGEKADLVKPIRMKRGEGIVGWVIEERRVAVVNDAANDPRFFNKVDEESGFRTRSILCVPMATRKRLWGALEVVNKKEGGCFDEQDIALCNAIAAQAAIAIENAMLHEKIVGHERLAAVGQTVAGLAHCIKNVLNGIQGGAYMVDSGLKKGRAEHVEKGWEIVRKNNAFMQELVLDMLNYSKEREPVYAPTDINEVIDLVCSLSMARAQETGVRITWPKDAFPRLVMVDPHGIRRCLLNLVGNAVDACAAAGAGEVEVRSALADGERLQIVVRDTGPGIPEEDCAKLFQPFFSTKGSKGTGLGLAVTHKIVTEHEGAIRVDSKPGQGAEFTVDLPFLDPVEFREEEKECVDS